MRNHDFVSDGFLALIATCLVMLCSGWLVIAFGQPASSVFGLLQ
jgi:cytochrome b561